MNNIIKYTLLENKSSGLGYTTWAKTNCSDMVERGKRAQRIAEDYENKYRNLSNDFESMKKGYQQKDLENAKQTYADLMQKRDDLKIELRREQLTTEAWRISPHLHYQSYLDEKGMQGMGNWWSRR